MIDSLKKELLDKKKFDFIKLEALIASIEKARSEIALENQNQTNLVSKTERLQENKNSIEKEKNRKGKITVIDKRNPDKHHSESRINTKNVTNKTRLSKASSVLRTEGDFVTKDVARIPVDLHSSTNHEIDSKNNFANVIERAKNFISDKVFKTGVIVVRDDGNGEIRFQLKPESLGNIRMKLTINENHIVGKIIVENNSVRDVLNNNIDSLKDALKDSGFQTATFDVSVGNQLSDSRESRSENREFKEGKIKISAIEEIEKNIPRFWDLNSNDLLVDLVV